MPSLTGQHLKSDLAVIIPYYDGGRFIGPCISSLLRGNVSPDHIYIVDNDPSGHSDESVNSNDSVTVIRSRPGIGFGRAVNVGVARALEDGYSLFFVLNQDTLVDALCLSTLIDYYRSSTPLTMTVPMMREYDSMALRSTFSKYIVGKQTRYFEDQEKQLVKRAYPITTVGTAALLFGKDTWETIGLFDPVFHMYGEDDDLLKRFIECGGRLYLVTDAYVHHYHSLSRAEGEKKRQVSRWFNQSRMLLRIRRTDLSRFGYLIRAFYYFARSCFRQPSPDRISGISTDHLLAIPGILSNWNALKYPSADSIRKRIETAIKQDLQ